MSDNLLHTDDTFALREVVTITEKAGRIGTTRKCLPGMSGRVHSLMLTQIFKQAKREWQRHYGKINECTKQY